MKTKKGGFWHPGRFFTRNRRRISEKKWHDYLNPFSDIDYVDFKYVDSHQTYRTNFKIIEENFSNLFNLSGKEPEDIVIKDLNYTIFKKKEFEKISNLFNIFLSIANNNLIKNINNVEVPVSKDYDAVFLKGKLFEKIDISFQKLAERFRMLIEDVTKFEHYKQYYFFLVLFGKGPHNENVEIALNHVIENNFNDYDKSIINYVFDKGLEIRDKTLEEEKELHAKLIYEDKKKILKNDQEKELRAKPFTDREFLNLQRKHYEERIKLENDFEDSSRHYKIVSRVDTQKSAIKSHSPKASPKGGRTKRRSRFSKPNHAKHKVP